ncbi:serine hydrolase [Kangiella sp. TOML190]|uniref:serine hydrolase domain-containing protein n=1 Tax=Kangiella sp. TOML190 TaxID=2931351 RepID=UPI0020425E26|nr:serine hydrolase domain-containing protein [Kangiella sp. TOML190]
MYILRYKKTIVFSLIIIMVVWFLQPIYSFYAHKDKLPLPFWGWHQLPEKNPLSEKLYGTRFTKAAQKSLHLIDNHKNTIHSPAISVAVAIDNKLVWAAATGWQDITGKKPITINSRFRIGSTSKAINSIALARLVDAGKINLDHTVDHYIKPLPNPAWQYITPRMLASHSSGLPHYKENTDLFGLYKTITLSTAYESMIDALEIFDSAQLLSQPGSQFSYSTLGTVLLGAVMESVEQKSYFKLVDDLVFEPLNITDVIIAPTTSTDGTNIATSYKRDNRNHQPNLVRKWRPVDLSHRLPGGGFAATSSDLVKLASAFIDTDFISLNTQQLFLQPQRLADGKVNAQNYAIGWRIANTSIGHHELVMHANHGGVSRGAQSWLMVLPKYRMAVAVNINSNVEHFWDFAKISMDIAEAFLDQLNLD